MSFSTFTKSISQVIPQERLLSDPLELLAHGTDASFYRLIPKLVVKPADETQLIYLLKQASKYEVPLTFRTAGTSLSGQAISDSVLVKLGHDWKGYMVEDGGRKIRLQPGVIGSQANSILKAYGRKIGPDPASIDSAMIGGIAANNASGMCCGTAQNSYQTLASMRVILADGTVLDSNSADSLRAFCREKPVLLESLDQMRREILNNDELSEKIRTKYRIKNTTGYSLNSFIDYKDPVDILLHLMIGSEGTLGFISEITYHTVEEPAQKSCALVLFNDIAAACRATALLKNTAVTAVELMDEISLELMKGRPGGPTDIADGCMALLIDVRAADEAQLENMKVSVREVLQPFEVKCAFTSNEQNYAELWKIRKGLFPIVGANRPQGTTVIIEDICFPLEELAVGTAALKKLLAKHGYNSAVIFGHALEGNLHFVFTQDFNSPQEVKRYAAFMEDLAKLVTVEHSGSLKAEHGTGRNMAPFVEAEWGTTAYGLMKRIKRLFDPQNILNPEVIISKNPQLHLENLKPIPVADELVDQCIECGFCESVCPSRDLTLSPRQRIAVWREMSQQKRDGKLSAAWEKSFAYHGEDTCAGDGMCSTRCPVGIDTGKLIKKLRGRKLSPLKKKVARFTGRHFRSLSYVMRYGLKAASLSRSLIGRHACNDYPQAATKSPLKEIPGEEKVVYFSSCLHLFMGPASGKSQPQTLMSLLKKSGYGLILPKGSKQLCCGLPYESKGFEEEAANQANELLEELETLTEGGRYPVICDNSPCSFRMLEQLVGRSFKLYDAVSFFAENLQRLNIDKKSEDLLFYSVCSQKKAGKSDDLLKLATACCTSVKVTEGIECCGFGGDRGFSHPELNASSLKELKDQVDTCSKGYSSSRTCEIGLERHSGIPFGNILQLLDECSAASQQ